MLNFHKAGNGETSSTIARFSCPFCNGTVQTFPLAFLTRALYNLLMIGDMLSESQLLASECDEFSSFFVKMNR